MKLEPIINPHARMKQNQKSTKEEEREVLMQATKQKVQDRLSKRAEEKKKAKTQFLQSNKQGEGFEMEQGGFSLGD